MLSVVEPFFKFLLKLGEKSCLKTGCYFLPYLLPRVPAAVGIEP